MAKSDSDAPLAPSADAQQQQAQIQVDDSGVEAHYANFFAATGTMEEVILDFGNRGRTPQDKIKIDSRVVVSVFNAKRILAALAQTINMYEERFGKIELDPRKRMQNPPQ